MRLQKKRVELPVTGMSSGMLARGLGGRQDRAGTLSFGSLFGTFAPGPPAYDKRPVGSASDAPADSTSGHRQPFGSSTDRHTFEPGSPE